VCKDVEVIAESVDDMPENKIEQYKHYRLTMYVKAPTKPSESPNDKWRIHYTSRL
jgi:hypothetical protein